MVVEQNAGQGSKVLVGYLVLRYIGGKWDIGDTREWGMKNFMEVNIDA